MTTKKQREKSELNCRDRYDATAKIPCKKITDNDRKKAIAWGIFMIMAMIIAFICVFGF